MLVGIWGGLGLQKPQTWLQSGMSNPYFISSFFIYEFFQFLIIYRVLQDKWNQKRSFCKLISSKLIFCCRPKKCRKDWFFSFDALNCTFHVLLNVIHNFLGSMSWFWSKFVVPVNGKLYTHATSHCWSPLIFLYLHWICNPFIMKSPNSHDGFIQFRVCVCHSCSLVPGDTNKS